MTLIKIVKNHFFLFLLFFIVLDDGFIEYKEFQDYFGHDFLTSEPSIVDLTTLFHEIDINHSGNITLTELLKFFNHQSPMITKEEGEIFLGTISNTGNENSISFKGKILLY
jgi:Ca2+-binding EF-hand superfamily protein